MCLRIPRVTAILARRATARPGGNRVNRLMNRTQALLTCAYAGLTGVSGRAFATRCAPRVAFLNPREAVRRGTGQHWHLVSPFMTMAARSFAIQLDVLYAAPYHLLMQRPA